MQVFFLYFFIIPDIFWQKNNNANCFHPDFLTCKASIFWPLILQTNIYYTLLCSLTTALLSVFIGSLKVSASLLPAPVVRWGSEFQTIGIIFVFRYKLLAESPSFLMLTTRIRNFTLKVRASALTLPLCWYYYITASYTMQEVFENSTKFFSDNSLIF